MSYSREYRVEVVNNLSFSLNTRMTGHWVTLSKNIDSSNSPTLVILLSADCFFSMLSNASMHATGVYTHTT